MTNRIQIREIGAWTVLVIALVLLSVSIAFSQTKGINVESENGKTHVKITKTENGITTSLDTTFESNDQSDIDAVINQFGGVDGETIIVNSNTNTSGNKKQTKLQKVIVDLDLPEISDADMERFNSDMKKSMKAMKKGLHDMQVSLKNMHVQIDTDEDLKDLGMDENYNEKEYVVIKGGSDENPPVFEKVVTSKDGKKVFIYKRSNPDKGTSKDENKSAEDFHLPGIENIKYYPNPTDGKITVSFNSTQNNDIVIKIVDENNQEVFKRTLDDFKGEYSKEIDLSDKSKGNYFLKIASGKKAMSRVIVVN